MAVKTKQQLKEETLKELEAEEKKLKEAEEKKQQTAAAQAKANKEADLIGAKDAEKLSSGSKTTTSSSSAADKAKNSSVTKNSTASEAKQTVSDSVAKKSGAQSGIDKIEAEKTEKATARAKANKEADLPGYEPSKEKETGLTARQKAQNKASESVSDKATGKDKGAQELRNNRLEQQNALSENIVNVLGGMDAQLRGGAYDNATDNALASYLAEWIYSPGAAIAQGAQAVGETLKQDDKQYISPAAARRYNIGGNIAERAGAEDVKDFEAGETVFSEAPELRKALGERLVKAYEENAALEYKKQAELRRTAALEQSDSELGDLAINLGGALNSMAVAGAYSSITGTSISSYMAFTGGTEKTADLIEEGYNPLAAIGAGVAWGTVLKEIEGSSSFGHINGGIVDKAAKKIGDKAVKVAGKYIDGKTVASAVELSKGPIAKRIFGGLSEGAEEMAEYSLEYVFDSVLGREDISFDTKEFFYSGLVGALAGEIFEFSTIGNLPAEYQYYFSEEGKAERADEIKNYLDSVDPNILGTAGTGNIPATEQTMKNIPAEKFDEAVPEEIKNAKAKAEAKKTAEFDEAVAIGKKLGVTVEFDPNIAGNGVHTSDGRIIINPNTENPALQVFVHELTHDIETSGLYGAFSEKILSHITEQGYDINKIREQVKADYEAEGHNLTDRQLDAEVVAKYCEQHLFTDEKAIQRLCDTEPTVFQKIKNWISDMVVKFTGSPEEKFLRNAEKLYAKALATRGEAAGAGTNQNAIAVLDDGKTYVTASRKVINSQTKDGMRKEITDFFNNLLNGNKSLDIQTLEGDVLTITKADTAFKARDDAYSLNGKPIKMSDAEFAVKLKAEAHIDELAETAVKNNKPYAADTKNHPFAKDGFEYRTAYFQDYDGQFYKLSISIGHNGNTATIYNVGKIEKSASPSANIIAVVGSSAPGETLSDKRIPQNSPVVNDQHSVGRGFDEMANATDSDGRKLSKEQAEFFKDSKVRDENGNLIPMYHGTPNGNFTIFRSGTYFTQNPEYAKIYQNPGASSLSVKRNADNPRNYKVYLDIKKPFDTRNPKERKIFMDEYYRKWGTGAPLADSGLPDWTDGMDLQEFIEEMGYDYDGLILDEGATGGYGEEVKSRGLSYVIFSPEQVKNIDNKNPTSNPDYRYSTGQSFDEMAAEAKTPSMERADAQLNADDWKGIAESINPETGIWRMKDFARVLDSAAGGNKVLRQQLYDLYEKPLNEAQGEYARNYGEKAKQISDRFKELGIKTGSKESAAVQRIGEGVKEINKNGDTEPYTLEDLKRDFPDSWQNIKEGADYCRTVYDKFLNDLNAMYSEIYPATVEQANEKISGYDTRISAYNTKIENIRTVVENLETLRAEKQAELAKKKQTTLIYGGIQNQIVNIDQRIEKAGKIIERLNNRKFTKEIARDTLKAQVENGEILKNKQIRPRKDYFRHFQELTNEFAEIADIFSNDQRIPPDLAGKSETTKPRTIWTSLAQQRGKNYYTEDAVGGLLRYTEIAEKLLAYDPLISHFRDVNSAIRAAGTMVENEVKGKGTNAGQFAAWADDITNQLAGKTNAIDRFITDRTGALGRATIKSIEALNRRVKSNAILGNFRSALVQIGNIPTANLYISNPIDWAKGVVSTAGSVFGSSQEISEARKHSNFMNRRYMGDTINGLTKEIQSNNILNKPKEFALWMLGAGDRAAAELIWHTAYTKAVQNPQTLTAEENRRNYKSAIDYADDITRRSIAGRAEGDIPYFEESKLTGLVAPFQIEVANTFNAFTEQLGEKNAAGILAFEVSVFLMNTVLEAMTGDRPLGLDFVDVALDLVKEAIGDEEDEEEKDLWEFIKKAVGRIGGEILSSMPFGTQIGSFLTGGDEQKAEDWFGDTDPTRYGTGNIGMGALADALDYFISGENPEKFFNLVTDGQKNSYKEWAAPIVETAETFAPLLMPWGGKQAARTLGGLDQIIQGGAYGEKNGEEYLKYLQGDEPGDIAKTLLFGKYGGSTAQEYIDSGFKGTLSSKQTKQMELAEQYGISNEDFYDVVLGLKDYSKKADKQEALFNNPDLSAEEKDVLDYILFGDANSKAAENGYVEPERAYSSEEAFYRSGLSDSENRLLDAGYSREDAKAIEKAISTGKNKEEKVAEISKALGCSEEEALEAYYKKEGRWVSDRKDLSKDEISNLDKMAEMYEVDDEGYFAARNAILTSDGEKDEYGNTISGSTKKEAIENIRKELGCSKEEATIYYLAANGDLILSVDDLSSSHREDLEIAIKHGWTERQYIDAVNLIKVSGATKKADIIKTLTDAGASYEMAQGYYNLRENKDYDRKVS